MSPVIEADFRASAAKAQFVRSRRIGNNGSTPRWVVLRLGLPHIRARARVKAMEYGSQTLTDFLEDVAVLVGAIAISRNNRHANSDDAINLRISRAYCSGRLSLKGMGAVNAVSRLP